MKTLRTAMCEIFQGNLQTFLLVIGCLSIIYGIAAGKARARRLRNLSDASPLYKLGVLLAASSLALFFWAYEDALNEVAGSLGTILWMGCEQEP